MLLQGMNARFTGIIISADNEQQIVRRYLLEFIPQFHRETMISPYFTRQRFVSVEILPKTDQFNSTFFTETILLNIVQFVSVFRPKMRDQDYWMHIDNAKSHNSALSLQKTKELGFTLLTQPPYSPDLVSCDFFVFGYLKKELHGKNFRFQNGVNSVMRAILTKILIQTLSRVFDEWIERLHKCIANEVEYI
jgi:hypothetical protein